MAWTSLWVGKEEPQCDSRFQAVRVAMYVLECESDHAPVTQAIGRRALIRSLLEFWWVMYP